MIFFRALNPAERLLLAVVPAVFVAMEGVARLVPGSVPPTRTLSPFYNSLAFTLAAALIVVCLARRRDLGPLLALGALFEVARMALAVAKGVPLADSLSALGLGVWSAAMVLQLREAVRTRGAERRKALDLLLTQFALPAGIALTFFGNSIVRVLVPTTLDPSLYVIDGLLPVPVARLVARFASDHAWAYTILSIAYHALFASFAAIILLDRRSGNHPGKFVSLVLLIGLAGFLLYFIAPGTSPQAAFYDRYSGVLPDPALVDLARFAAPVSAPRNAMPSLHTTYALVMLIAAARFGAGWLTLAGLFTLLTVLATMALREHYVIDLVVAVPLALATTWFLAAFDPEALTARCLVCAGLAFAIVLAWLLIVRLGTASLREVPWLASALVLATFAAAAAIGVPRPLPGRDQRPIA